VPESIPPFLSAKMVASEDLRDWLRDRTAPYQPGALEEHGSPRWIHSFLE